MNPELHRFAVLRCLLFNAVFRPIRQNDLEVLIGRIDVGAFFS